MLDKVEVRTDQGSLLTLSLQDAYGGITVQDIEGLDPVKATMVSSTMAQLDGEQYQTSRREKRNIIFTLGFDPDYVNTSVDSLRKRLYTFFMPKSRVMLRFFPEGEDPVDIYGLVESFDSPKFTKDPLTTISVLCFDPDFFDPTPTILSGTTVGNTLETTHVYPGTVETGILFRLMVDRSLSAFTIHHRPGDGSLRTFEFATATPLASGDVVMISTVPGSKYVNVKKGAVITPYLFSVTPQSNWISLFPGSNKLRIFAEGAGVPYEIEYTTKFGGL